MRLLKSPRLIVGCAARRRGHRWPSALLARAGRGRRRGRSTAGPLQVTIDEEGETRVRERFVVSAPVAGRLLRIELEPGDPVAARPDRAGAARPPPTAPLLDARTRGELDRRRSEATARRRRPGPGRARSAPTRRSTRARAALRASAGAGRRRAPSPRDSLEAAADRRDDRAEEAAARRRVRASARAEHELQVARARLQAPAAGGRPVDDHRARSTASCCGGCARASRSSRPASRCSRSAIRRGSRSSPTCCRPTRSASRPARGVLIEQWGGGAAARRAACGASSRPASRRSRRSASRSSASTCVIDFADGVDAGTRARRRLPRRGADRRLGRRRRPQRAGRQPLPARRRVGGLRRGERRGASADRRARTAQRLEAQILNGLTAGETVVLHPPDTLADGTRVRIR